MNCTWKVYPICCKTNRSSVTLYDKKKNYEKKDSITVFLCKYLHKCDIKIMSVYMAKLDYVCVESFGVVTINVH